MPRKEIDLDCRIEHLSILSEDGKVDEELEPDISEELLLKIHRTMLLCRRFDERLFNLQRQGKIGTFGPIKGQEASALGAAAALADDDWLVPSFREMAAEVWRGKRLEDVLLVYGGYGEGGCMAAGVNNLPVAIPVASQVPHAVGIAYALAYDRSRHVAMAFFGDGATSEGDFHEALNFAGVLNAPAVFICQNNHWAISVPRSRQTHSKTIAQKALAYGIAGIQVDGNDILAVYAAAREAVERARSGGGPTLIECVTYRMSVHTTADDPKRYRTDDEVAEWEKRDPLSRFQKYLLLKKFLSDEKLADIEAEVKAEIQAAVDSFEERAAQAADSLAMFDHIYESLPPYLQEQRAELKTELEAKKQTRD